MKPLGIGVVGAGFWAGAMHLPAFASLPGARVVAVAGGSAERAEATARAHGIERWTTDYRDLIADPAVDVIDILAPNFLHAPVALEAIGAGKHVICIKPLARTLDEGREMVTAARAAGVRLLYAENVPFIPAVQQASKVVASGGIGRVFRIKACEGIGTPHSEWFLDPERSGGGAIIDMAVHSMAFCRHFAGADPVSAFAMTDNFTLRDRTPAEDTAVITLRFADGTIGQCEDSWSLTGAMDSRFEVFGTQGRILIDNLHRQPIQVVSSEGYRLDGEPAGSGWTYPLPVPGAIADGHVAMLDHFLAALREDRHSDYEGEDGLALLAAVDAAQRSARTGALEAIDYSTKKESCA